MMYSADGLRFKFAHTLIGRLLGLISKDICKDGEALVFPSCHSIHTFCMKEDIDVAFIDEQGHVLKAVRSLPPRCFCFSKSAIAVLERRGSKDSPWFVVDDTVRLIAWRAERDRR